MTASVNPLVIEIERLRKQLAAERELHKHATENNLALANIKLAVERERSEGFKRELRAALSDLVAERSKVKELEERLKGDKCA